MYITRRSRSIAERRLCLNKATLSSLFAASLCLCTSVNSLAQKPDWENQLESITPQYNSSMAGMVIPVLEKRLDEAVASHDVRKQIVGHTKLGQVYLDAGNYQQAISHSLAAIELSKTSQDQKSKYYGEALATLARAYGRVQQHQKARHYAELHRTFLTQNNGSAEAIARATWRLALTHGACGERAKEIPLLENSLHNAAAFSSNQHLLLRTKLELGLAIWHAYSLDTSKLQTAQGQRVTRLMHEICNAPPTEPKVEADIKEARAYMNALGLK
jgi:tetratricopeptide (TPR) repeat protein